MSAFSRAWETMTARERIVAMSLVTGGVVAMVNSTVWAVATCYMAYQKARVRIADAHEAAYMRLGREVALSHFERTDFSDADDADETDEIPPDSLTTDTI